MFHSRNQLGNNLMAMTVLLTQWQTMMVDPDFKLFLQL